MSVLLLPPIFQFFDNNGDPLANGFVYTYAAGTTTPQATFTDSTGTIAAPNPIELNAAGRPTSGGGAIWGDGAYKFIVKDANGVQVGDALDNVTSFTTLASASSAYFQSFSGNGSQTLFTTSTDLGDEEKGLMVFVSKGLEEIAVNGTFTTDTGWTKGAGWTIAAGVATATGAISTAISQVPVISLVVGQAYAVTYTITRSAGGLIPSLGGQNGTERVLSGTYREVIIAAATTPIAFTGNAFTGTLDSVSITRADAQGYDIVNPSAYTISGTSLTFASAPATGTNNIYVFSPSSLVGAASSAAALAQIYATNALASQTAAAASEASAAAYAARNKWNYSTTTTMANPATANIRFNNASLASVTQIAISDLSANAGNPNVGAWIDTWDNAGGTNSGSIFIFKDESNFAIYNVNSASTDNTTWFQVPVTYIAHSGSFSNLDALYIGFAASGNTVFTGDLPVSDVTPLIKGSADATKLARFEVDGFTTGTTRVFGLPNYNGDLATVAGSELFYNKTLFSPSLAFLNSAFTRYFGFSGDTLTANRTLAFPDAAGTISTTNPPRATYSNLKIDASSATQAVVTADSLVLRTAAGLAYEATTVNVTAAITASGANGLDTGAEAANTWYYVYVIYNGTTVASLLSVSATTPTLPSGYTYYARVGAVRNDASSNLWRTLQYNDDVQIRVGTNPTNMPIISAAAVGNVATTWSSTSITSFVPTTAVRIRLSITRGGVGTTSMILAPNASYGFQGNTTNPPALQKQMSTIDGAFIDMALEATTIQYASDSASNTLCCMGWKDNL